MEEVFIKVFLKNLTNSDQLFQRKIEFRLNFSKNETFVYQSLNAPVQTFENVNKNRDMYRLFSHNKIHIYTLHPYYQRISLRRLSPDETLNAVCTIRPSVVVCYVCKCVCWMHAHKSSIRMHFGIWATIHTYRTYLLWSFGSIKTRRKGRQSMRTIDYDN